MFDPCSTPPWVERLSTPHSGGEREARLRGGPLKVQADAGGGSDISPRSLLYIGLVILGFALRFCGS